jgi:hypothetical protein
LTGGFNMKRNSWSSRLVLRAVIVFAGTVGVFSPMVSATPQQADPQIAIQERIDNQVFIQGGQAAIPGPPLEIGFQSFGPIVPGKVVKGAPYSAVASTEMTQLLSDGNQINHKMTSNIYRDSQGRTRREENFSGIGLLAINGKQARGVVFISDPVSGSEYILEPENKIARRMPSLPADGVGATKFFRTGRMGGSVQVSGVSGIPAPTEIHVTGGPVQVSGLSGIQVSTEPGVQTSTESHFQTSTESLGQQTIEGVIAEGKRTTTTIAAGAMGNLRPLTAVTEEWFSRDLQVIVLSTTKDPRIGETTYRLTNLQKAEPPATLFALPADYVVKDFDKPEFLPRPPQSNE